MKRMTVNQAQAIISARLMTLMFSESKPDPEITEAWRIIQGIVKKEQSRRRS